MVYGDAIPLESLAELPPELLVYRLEAFVEEVEKLNSTSCSSHLFSRSSVIQTENEISKQ